MMISTKKVNTSSKANPDTGFGVQANQIGGRFVNKDGSFNMKKDGLPILNRISFYSNLLELSWTQFFAFILLFYLLANIVFTILYLLAGYNELQGLIATTMWGRAKEIFFFSTETFTTVGYGRVNPIGDEAHLIASLESMTGFLSFALLTGLLYGRFSRPKAYIAFSENALISPYKDGIALMFRMVPYKVYHDLTDAQVTVNLAFTEMEEGKPVYKFYQLKLEREKINIFSMNWTVVHPIDEESPLLNFTKDDMKQSDLELYVQVSGFDNIFSNMVMHRSSYTYEEIIWGAKFRPMYHESPGGNTTILELDKLNEFEKVNLP
ncbi:ion channel [Segetibacter koreensis]|uniref:ion channel n=1 Tax=Segetibacter koreensis TaxID=398037 RepID=UPI001FE23740|nr:ion channel [Segetibacter koreensis]